VDGLYTTEAETKGETDAKAEANAAFHSCRDLVFTRSRDPGNHQFTTCQWNAF